MSRYQNTKLLIARIWQGLFSILNNFIHPFFPRRLRWGREWRRGLDIVLFQPVGGGEPRAAERGRRVGEIFRRPAGCQTLLRPRDRWDTFWFGGILGVSASRAEFPVSLSNHVGFTPRLVYSSIPTPHEVLSIWKKTELKRLNDSDRTRTGITVLTSAADDSEPWKSNFCPTIVSH